MTVRRSYSFGSVKDFEHYSFASKRRFWNPKKWFRRKNKVSDDVVVLEVTETNTESLRSRSTSELSVAEEGRRRRSSSSMHPGLSVSHDSVFHSPNSESDMELDAAQSSSSLSICQPFTDSRLQTELIERLRVRRGRGDVSEDDEGFPHSSCNSPTASDGLLLDKTAIKDLPTKSHSTCSDGSLLSMGSYGLDEDSSDPQSRHSSKLSLHEKNQNLDSSTEFGPSSTVTPLNHSAAHHRVAVKPKRTHGAPRRKRGQAISIALPATPEVNEDSSLRSISPENNKKEILTELYSMNTTRTITEIKCSSLPPGLAAPGSESTKLNRSKSNAGSNSQDLFNTVHEDKEKEEKVSLLERLFPRKSGRKKKLKEEKESSTKQETVIKSESSEIHKEVLKSTNEQRDSVVTSVKESITETSSIFTNTSSSRYESSKPIPAPRSGPASRQRIQPMDIPSTPDEIRRDANMVSPNLPPEKSMGGTSPLQTELENRFKQRQVTVSVSPPKSITKQTETPPLSPRISKPPQSPILPTVISSKLEYSSHISQSSSNTTRKTEIKPRNDEFRSKMKLPSLSALQQRVLSLNDDDTDNGFKSLIDFPNDNTKENKPLTKSQSFKAVKKNSFDSENSKNASNKIATAEFLSKEQNDDNKISFTKASSLDSVKNLDEQKIHFSEMRVELKRSKPDLHKKNLTSEPNSKTENTKDDANIFNDSPITISGPSHTAIVNVTSNKEEFAKKTHIIESGSTDESQSVSIKEHQVSITKIQVKQEATQVTQSTIVLPKTAVPEFWSKQLNKVETRPTSNIIFSMKSPKVIEEQNHSKSAFSFENTQDIVKLTPMRKFSKENLEIIEKNSEDESSKPSPVVSSTTVTIQTPRFKKNENKNRKSSLVSISTDSTPLKDKALKNRSSSLDSLKSEMDDTCDKSSQNSLDQLDTPKDKNSSSETVVLRKKTITVQKKDDEPELMKVFARRSLKIKDSDVDLLHENLCDSKIRDSDKENQIDSSVEVSKKLFKSEITTETEVTHRKYNSNIKKEETIEVKPCVKEPLVENKSSDVTKTNNTGGDSPIMTRRNINNNLFYGQRAISLNPAKSISTDRVIKKQSSFCERRKVGNWINSISNEETDLKDNVNKDDLIDNLSPKSDFITEPKNFNQRKAEWEKRAQMSQKKNTP